MSRRECLLPLSAGTVPGAFAPGTFAWGCATIMPNNRHSCFVEHDAKQPDLRDVIFPAWIDWERRLLFGGLSDTTIGVVPVSDPFGGTAPVEIGHG